MSLVGQSLGMKIYMITNTLTNMSDQSIFLIRNHIHFSAGEPGEDGVISGMRKSAGINS